MTTLGATLDEYVRACVAAGDLALGHTGPGRAERDIQDALASLGLPAISEVAEWFARYDWSGALLAPTRFRALGLEEAISLTAEQRVKAKALASGGMPPERIWSPRLIALAADQGVIVAADTTAASDEGQVAIRVAGPFARDARSLGARSLAAMVAYWTHLVRHSRFVAPGDYRENLEAEEWPQRSDLLGPAWPELSG